MSYNTTIAIVFGGYGPRHIDLGYLHKREGKNLKVTFAWQHEGSKRDKKGKPPKGTQIDLHDYGRPLIVMDLGNVGYETNIFNLFKAGREKSKAGEVWPFFASLLGKEVTHDCYNEPLGVHRLEEVLTALSSTMSESAASGDRPCRRFQSLLDLLVSIRANEQYEHVYVLTYGH